jgi:hypothetical protein
MNSISMGDFGEIGSYLKLESIAESGNDVTRKEKERVK